MNVGDRIEVRCDRLTYGGGRALGKYQGAVVFVRGACPDETITAEIVATHKNYFEADLAEVLSPSPYRRKAPCPVFGRCGGCVWQQLNYEAQIRAKHDFLKNTLREFPDVLNSIKIYPAKNEFNYRNRIQIHKKGTDLGYYARGSNSIVSITECLIAEPIINLKIKDLQSSKFKDGKYEIGLLEDSQYAYIKQIKGFDAAFRQINTTQNQVLKSVVIEFAKLTKPTEIVELYSGSGNFTFALAAAMPQMRIKAIETNSESVTNAQKYAHLHNLEHLEIIKADAKKYLKRIQTANNYLLLVDPPRAGLESLLVEDILNSMPQNIIYVSCNLATLERDLKKLKPLYSVVNAAGVDMFPQTDYLESVVLLALRAKKLP